MKALLVIDMQHGSFSPDYPCHDEQAVVARIGELSRKFREVGYPVIYIQHDGTDEGEYVPGTSDWEILPELAPLDGDIVVSKTVNDAFHSTELARILADRAIAELVITGSATDFCVNATIQSALTKGYDLVVASDAHTTADHPGGTSANLVEHYNWVWGNLNPVNRRIRVVPVAEILGQLG